MNRIEEILSKNKEEIEQIIENNIKNIILQSIDDLYNDEGLTIFIDYDDEKKNKIMNDLIAALSTEALLYEITISNKKEEIKSFRDKIRMCSEHDRNYYYNKIGLVESNLEPIEEEYNSLKSDLHKIKTVSKRIIGKYFL